jgi:hypothetical protein
MMLQDIQNQIYEVEKQQQLIEKEYEAKLSKNRAMLVDLYKQLKLVLCGADIEKVKVAESIFEVKGLRRIGNGDAISKINEAIKDITAGFVKIRKQYFGCKDYECFSCQGSDHEYGYGPRHGSTVFSIGLRQEKRNTEFTPEEIDACLYYLLNLKITEFVESLLAAKA